MQHKAGRILRRYIHGRILVVLCDEVSAFMSCLARKDRGCSRCQTLKLNWALRLLLSVQAGSAHHLIAPRSLDGGPGQSATTHCITHK